MSSVEVVVKLTAIDDNVDIEELQDSIMDALYAHGFTHVAPIKVSRIDEPCGCCGQD